MIKTSLALLSFFLSIKVQAALPLSDNPWPTLKSEVIVAVIDTGVDIHHPLIKDSLWSDKDHLHGWNFIDQSANISDQHGHGTHIAGIIAQNKNIKLMILKALDPTQTGDAIIDATVNAVHYAIKMRADIINYSGGGTLSHPRERKAFELAQKHGILVVAAAGNFHANMDDHGFFPARYPLKNIIAVAAVDHKDQLLTSSNFGPQSVLVAAQGKDIGSALPNKKMGMMSGTSQATAKVTRVLASLIGKSKNPIQTMIRHGRQSNALVGKIKNPVIIEDE